MNLLFFAIALCGLFVSYLYMLKPEAAIEFQKRFYERINWRITPISMAKEIRNTRLMGALLAAVSLSTLIIAIFA